MNVPDEQSDQFQVDVLTLRTRKTFDRRPRVLAGTGNISQIWRDEIREIAHPAILLFASLRKFVPVRLLRTSGRPFRGELESGQFQDVLQIVFFDGEREACRKKRRRLRIAFS